MKKTILHFIYNLGRGGAETLLVRSIRELSGYNNIVVTLFDDNRFTDELKCDKYICMNLPSLSALPLAIFTLRKMIKNYHVDLVHTHLFWPTMIARIATPRRIPLVTTIHAFIASSLEYKKWYIRIIDKITYYKRRSVILADARGALEEYFSFLNLKPYKSYVLYTFVDLAQFKHQRYPDAQRQVFRLISTGALRLQKNYPFIIKAFTALRNENIELHIYGSGPLMSVLQKLINKNGVKVVLKGEVKNIHEVLPQYDAFVMASIFEGFSLAVLEAMAVKLPLLLSDIDSFNEQCADTAVYFDLTNEDDFIKKVLQLKADKSGTSAMAEDAYQRVVNNFTLPHHIHQLQAIYAETLNGL